MIAFPSTSSALPRPRRSGPQSRPRVRASAGRWRWSGPAMADALLAPGDPFHDENRFVSRRTPCGLTEVELLASFNYLERDALLAFDGIGPTLAGNILDQRARNQYFASLDELALVPLIGPKRFTKLTGRPPETTRFLLHDLMRRSRRDDIHFSDLHPWKSPAPDLASIWLRPAGEPAPVPVGEQSVITVGVRSHALHFVCTRPPSGGRAGFVHLNLPLVLRTLLS